MDEKEKVLLFLNNIECLKSLDDYTTGANFFEITGMVYREIKHSKFLSWLFDSNGNHKLNDRVFKRFILGTAELKDVKNDEIPKLSMIDYSSFIVKTEYKNIDLLAYSDKEKYVVAIENKVNATERILGDDGGQLNKYSKILDEEFAEYEKIKIFLTKDGYCSNQSDWLVSDYSLIAKILDDILNDEKNIDDDIKLLVSQYVIIIRKYLIMNEDLKVLCEKIYREHKEALDVIYQYRPDQVQVVSNAILDILKQYDGKLIFLASNNKKTYLRFTTPFIDEILPKVADTRFGWQNGYRFMYEIECGTFGVEVHGCISKIDDELCNKIYRFGQEHNKKYNITKKTKEPQLWGRTWKYWILKADEVSEFELDNCLGNLQKRIEKMLNKIADYEKDVRHFLNSN